MMRPKQDAQAALFYAFSLNIMSRKIIGRALLVGLLI